MAKFKPYVADQLMLFPPSLHDFVPQNHLSRAIDKIVEKLSTISIENKYSDLGQHTYHPRILIKLLFYGYAMGERSGRTIAAKIKTDTAYMYLAQMYQPDFRTINDFRKNNLSELSQFFVDIVRLCKELGLVEVGKINIDGTKIKADAANRLTKTQSQYQEWLEKTKTHIQEILDEAQVTDDEEDKIYGGASKDELPENINTEQKLKNKLEGILDQFEDKKGREQKINLTDPDAKFMKSGGKIETSYNCQIAATDNQFIVACDVVREPNDREQLKPVISQAQEIIGEDVLEVAADSGYFSYDNYEYLSENKITGYIPDQYLAQTKRQDLDKYSHENFMYDPQNDVYTCPEGKILKKHKTRDKTYAYRRWKQTIYKANDCGQCQAKTLCTKLPQRTIARDNARGLLEQMRQRLRSAEGCKKYLKRLCTVEPIFGHLKHNLKYRNFLLRTLEKVKTEFRLMCIGYNLKKMHLSGALGT